MFGNIVAIMALWPATTLTGQNTKVSGKMGKDMGTGHTSLLLEQDMRESGKTMDQMAMEFVIMQMEENLRENLRRA